MSPTPARSADRWRSRTELAAALSTVAALIVALVAWLYPRPAGSADTSAVPGPSLAAPSTDGSPTASAVPSATLAPSASMSRTVAASPGLVYSRQQLSLSCHGMTGPTIDLDEPRVLSQTGADLTYHCIDQNFQIADGESAGYLADSTPPSQSSCLEAIRSAAFDGWTKRISPTLSFCVETIGQSSDNRTVARVDVLTDGFAEEIQVAVTAWKIQKSKA